MPKHGFNEYPPLTSVKSNCADDSFKRKARLWQRTRPTERL